MNYDISPEDVKRYVVQGLARDLKKDINCQCPWRAGVFPLITYSIADGVDFKGFRVIINTIEHDQQSEPVKV